MIKNIVLLRVFQSCRRQRTRAERTGKLKNEENGQKFYMSNYDMNKKMNKLKICILLISLCSVFHSCVVYNEWHSEEGYIFDVSDFLYVFDNERNDSVKELEVYFSLDNCSHGIKSKEFESSPRTLSYSFHISSSYRVSSPIMPNVKINSFSFTDNKGDTIPTVLYVKLLNKRKILIDTLLSSLTDEVKNETKYDCVHIIVESDKSCYNTKLFYVNYDIEVGNKHYINQIKYRRKWTEILYE